VTQAGGGSLPGTSTRLQSPKFSGLIEQHLLADETIIDTIDGSVEVFEFGQMKLISDVAIVLTSRRLIAFRGRGMLGGKAPLVVKLDELETVGETKQFNVTVHTKDAHGAPGLWKLHLGGDPSASDRWMTQIHATAEGLAGGPAPGGDSGDPPAEWTACRARMQRFCDALAPLTRADAVGTPFGEGHGLEFATSLAHESFVDVDDAREADTMVAADLIANMSRFDDDELDRVRGVSSMDAGAATPPPADSVIALAGAAKTFLGQLGRDGSNIWELWKARDDVAVELLCWHAVARLRLATVGKLDPV
jgi:hypothetical protein